MKYNFCDMYKKITAFATALVISTGICSSCGLYSLAFDLTTKESSAISNDDAVSTSDGMYVENKPYSDYYNIYSGKTRPNTEILVDGADYSSVAGGDFSVGSYGSNNDIRNGLSIPNNSKCSVTYDINVAEEGTYCLNMSYLPIKSNNSDIELDIKIDGTNPYDSSSRIRLNKVWVNEYDVKKDSKGNQMRSPQIQKEMWCSADLKDPDGLFNDPLVFYLSSGMHSVTFECTKSNFVLQSFKFYNPKSLVSYNDYVNKSETSSNKNQTEPNIFRIEGENAMYKSEPTLCPTYDNSSYLVSPSQPGKILYNTFGNGNWNKSQQSVTWSIPANKIKHSGWYKIGIKSRQSEMRGMYSNRRIYIDDKVQCAEMDDVKFFYDTNWNVVSPKTSDGDFVYVYLTADVDHTITMEAIPGEIGQSIIKLNNIVSELNDYYRKILMITGPDPDKYTDYYVHEKIPELLDGFRRISGELKFVQSQIEKLSKSSGSEAAALERMCVILDKCVDKPLKIPEYVSQIKDNITAISSWMRDYREQPLEIDYIEFASTDKKFSGTDEKLLKSVKYSLSSFINSFFEDYTTISDVKNEDAIEVWVNLGRDQAQVVKELVESEFMQEYDIPVSVNLVAGGVVEASLAGKGPDVALFLGGEYPVNLASRGMLADLTQFSDYSDIFKRFRYNAAVNYQFNGGCYALPVTQSWPMLFYRKDILSELGFSSPPESWDELIDMLPAVQRNYMSVGLVLPQNNVSPATECGNTFAMLMLQKGLNYYNQQQTKSLFDEIGANDAFEQWTDFYTKYSFNQSYNAFSRFRTGEYPMVIANYSFYNQLSAASPEINGLWDFTSVPGTKCADGSISHAANSTGTGAVIFNKVKNKDDAWTFLKWFTSDKVQTEYGVKTEGLLGTMGRFEAANTATLENLSWSGKELSKLEAQRNELVEIPIIPASYAVTRNIMNAFRDVVNSKKNPRDTFMWYNRDINEEITRKRKNLGMDD